MPQSPQSVTNGTGSAVRAAINTAFAALFSRNSGTSAPTDTSAYMDWPDTTTATLKRRNAANTGWIVRDTLSETFLVSRSSNTILALSDIGKTFAATSTFTQTLTAAATLGDGWGCHYYNAGSGSITLDPNGSETINGATTLVLLPGQGGWLTCSGTAFTFIGNISTSTGSSTQIQPIGASVSSNALTLTASALVLDFRSTTLGSGTVTTVSGTPASLVISSGSTLGTLNGVKSRLALIALNNAGTIELAVVNVAGGNDLSETGLISTTAEGGAGAADTANVIYSTTARTNVAYRVIGYVESTQTTAGTWATALSTIQGGGGRSLSGLKGQKWQSVTRTSGAPYYNDTGKEITLLVTCQPSSNYTIAIDDVDLTVGGTNPITALPGMRVQCSYPVPAGQKYVITVGAGSVDVNELR